MLPHNIRLFQKLSPTFHHLTRSFSVTQLGANDDTFLLLQHQNKNIYLVGNTHTPNKTANKIFETIAGVKPDTVLLQICEHRADILTKLSVEYGDDLNDEICTSAALEDFANLYPLSWGIFSKSKTIIKPFELFGLLFSYSDYKAMHSALLNQSQLIFADNSIQQSVAQFEKSINKQYDPSGCLNPQNMFEKDIYRADLEREMAMGGTPREVQKRIMKQMMDRMLKNRPNAQQKEIDEKRKSLYLNQQLEVDLNVDGETFEQQDIEWENVYTRHNARVLVNELKESMKICVAAFIEERNKNICNMLMNAPGQNIVAFVNFANIDGIEDQFLHLS